MNTKGKQTNEKGITLVALIITIIILVILAAISIKAVYDSRIVNYAVNGATDYSGKAVEENGILDNTTAMLDSIIDDLKNTDSTNSWYYDEDGNVTNGEITLEIGDTVDYSPTKDVTDTNKLTYTSPAGTVQNSSVTADTTVEQGNGYKDQIFTASNYEGTWKVLGVNESTGEIMIMASEGIRSDNSDTFGLKGLTGARYGITELNNISKIYGYGYGASGARSITVEDVNKITGYNPLNTGVYDPGLTDSGTPYGSENLYEYGNEVRYYWQGTNYPYYSATNGLYGSLANSHSDLGFNWLNSTLVGRSSAYDSAASTSAMKEITTLENNYYTYYCSTLTSSSSSTQVGISSGSSKATMLFGQTGRGYWLASFYTRSNRACPDFGLRSVAYRMVSGHSLVETTR